MGGPLLAARNVLKGWLLLVGVSAALGGIGWLLGGYRLLSVFVFCGLLLALGMWWYSDRIALGMLRARELPVGQAPGLHSTVERLALRAGVAKPRLYLMPDSHPRAFAAGRGPRNSALAVSNGLLSVTAPAELEGVLAHELAHVRHRDLAVQTAVVVFAAALIELSRVGGFLQRTLLFVLAPLAGSARAPDAVAEARVPGRPGRRPRSAARRTRSRTAWSASSRRARSSISRRTPPPSRSTRSTRSPRRGSR